jgi:succinoglycan biosynthesis protein ExoA
VSAPGPGNRRGPPREQPTFSLVVPMRNEQGYVEETLRSLLAQQYPRDGFEILVVDGCSDDSSRAVVASMEHEHANLHLLTNPRRLPAAGRNVGIRAARGRFIGIVDCHSFVQSDFLSKAERLFQETGADCLGRPVELFIPTDSYLQRAIGAARTSWLGHNLVSPRYSIARGAISPLSVGILYRKEVFDRVGLFNEEFDACEDVEFNFRLSEAGVSTWTDPALRVYYHPRRSLGALFRQMRRYGYWRYRLLRAQQRAFHGSQAAPAAALAIAMSAVLASALGALPPVVPGILIACYAALLAVASVRAGLARGLRYLPVLPLAYATIHLGAAVGFWSGILSEMAYRIRRAPQALRSRGSAGQPFWEEAYTARRRAGRGLLAHGLKLRTAAAVEALSLHFAPQHQFSLLDVGSAGGEMLPALRQAFPGVIPIGLDRSRDLLTSRVAPEMAVQADATMLPFRTHSFDACLLAAVLKHVSRADQALAELARVVKPEGAVVIIDPSALAIRVGCLMGCLDKTSIAHRFTLRDLRRMLAAAGLEPVAVTFRAVHTAWPWLNSALNRAAQALRLFLFVPAWVVLLCRPKAGTPQCRLTDH